MSLGRKSYLNKHNLKTQPVIRLIFYRRYIEIATHMINYIKRTINGIEKTPTEYTSHLNGDIFAVVNVFKTYRFVHIRHYRDETYPLDGVDLVFQFTYNTIFLVDLLYQFICDPLFFLIFIYYDFYIFLLRNK